MMSFDVTYGTLTFTSRAGRKLFAPIQITLTGEPPFSIPGNCVVQVALELGGDPFSIEAVPGLWNPVPGGVQSKTTFAASGSGSFTAFAGFQFVGAVFPPLPPPLTQTYRLTVLDVGPSPILGPAVVIFTTTFDVSVSVQPALNKSVVFVLDRTASMGNGRLNRLKAAVTNGLGLFTAADSVGIVTLSNTTATVMGADVLAAFPSTIPNAMAACAGLSLDPSAPTQKQYPPAISLAQGQDAGATVLLVTDGQKIRGLQLVPPDVTLPPPAALFLNFPSKEVSSGVGANAISVSSSDDFGLEKFLSQMLLDLGGSAILSDPKGLLAPKGDLAYPVRVTETDREVELILFSKHADWLEVDLESKLNDGRWIKVEPPKDSYQDHQPPERSKTVQVKRVPLLRRRDELALKYRVIVSRPEKRSGSDELLAFTLIVAAQSDLMFEASATASGLETGADLLLSAHLTEYGLPVRNRDDLTISVELRHPDGFVETFYEHESGRLEKSRRSFQAGIYAAHFVATGPTLLLRKQFRRESLRSVVIFAPGASQICCPPRC